MGFTVVISWLRIRRDIVSKYKRVGLLVVIRGKGSGAEVIDLGFDSKRKGVRRRE